MTGRIDSGGLLRALQHGDSAFPSGGVAFSQGLEGLAALDGKPGAERVAAFLHALIATRWATFDRVALARSYRAAAGDLDAVAAIDEQVEAASIVEPLRTGSKRHGGALLALHARLGTAGAAAYRVRIAAGAAHGHLPVVQGLVWRAAGIDAGATTAMSGYGLAAGIVSAAIRLGLVGAVDGQRRIAGALDAIAAVSDLPVEEDEPLGGFSPHAELAAFRQAGAAMRLFSN